MSKSLHSLDNPLHQPGRLMPSRKPASPNSPDHLAQCRDGLEPNPAFPNGWPTSPQVFPKTKE